jgi:hypothetical protein
MMPMAFSGYSADPGAIAQTKMALDAIGLDKLDTLEIGNEPDLYAIQDTRPYPWRVIDYIPQWVEHSLNLAGNMTIPEGRIYSGLGYANALRKNWNV